MFSSSLLVTMITGVGAHLLDLGKGFESRHAGHHFVEDDQVVGSFGSHVDRVVSVVAGVHFIALLLEEQHVGLQQFDFVVDPEYFDHTVIGFRICKINVFIIKRKNPAVYWPGCRLNATFTPKKTK